MTEYTHGSTPSNELQVLISQRTCFERKSFQFNTTRQIYTWMDASLKEITNLIRDVNPDTRRKGEKCETYNFKKEFLQQSPCSGTYFDFALVFPDSRPGGKY